MFRALFLVAAMLNAWLVINEVGKGGVGQVVERVSGRVSFLAVGQRGGLGARCHVDGLTACLVRALAPRAYWPRPLVLCVVV